MARPSFYNKHWRVVLSVLLFAAGLVSTSWGAQHLVITSEVPSCVYPVNEKFEDLADSGGLQNESSIFGNITVEIVGAINEPGVYQLSNQARLVDLIDLAGGLSDQVNQERLYKQFNLAERLVDEQKVIIPDKDESDLEDAMLQYCQTRWEIEGVNSELTSIATKNTDHGEEVATNTNTANMQDNQALSQDKQGECTSINNANSFQLQTLSGVGEKTAELIIAGRPYSKITDLLDVKGIGDATLAKFEDQVCL